MTPNFTLFRRFSSGYICTAKFAFLFPGSTFTNKGYFLNLYSWCWKFLYDLHLDEGDIQHLTDAGRLITLKRVWGSNLITPSCKLNSSISIVLLSPLFSPPPQSGHKQSSPPCAANKLSHFQDHNVYSQARQAHSSYRLIQSLLFWRFLELCKKV